MFLQAIADLPDKLPWVPDTEPPVDIPAVTFDSADSYEKLPCYFLAAQFGSHEPQDLFLAAAEFPFYFRRQSKGGRHRYIFLLKLSLNFLDIKLPFYGISQRLQVLAG